MHFSGDVVCGKSIVKPEYRVGEFCKTVAHIVCFSRGRTAKLEFSVSACRNLIGKERSEIIVIACLQFGPLPIFAGKNATAIG